MTTAHELIERTRHLGIQLWVADGTLRFRAPRAVLSQELRTAIQANKESIIDALSGPRYVPVPDVGSIDVPVAYSSTWEQIRAGSFGLSYTNATNIMCRFRYSMDLETLERSLRSLAQRHNALRCRISDDSDGLRLIFDRTPEFVVADLSACAPSHIDAAMVQAAQDVAWRPFGPGECLFRAFALKLPGGEIAAGFVIHHFLVDGWSFSQLLGYWMSEYARHSQALPDDGAAARPLQCSDFMLGLARWSKTLNFTQRLEYWNETLRGAVATRLSPDRAVDLDAKTFHRCLPFKIDAARVKRLRSLATSLQVTLCDVLLAGIALALRGQLDSLDICIRHLWHGRDDSALFEMVGSTVNPIVLRLRLNPGCRLPDVARQVHRVGLEAFANQVPYYYVEKILHEAGATHFVQTNFPLLEGGDTEPEVMNDLPWLDARPVPAPHRPLATTRTLQAHDINLSVDNGALWCNVVYLEGVYDDATVLRFIGELDAALG